MGGLLNIIRAWIISYNPTPKEEELAILRAKICDECPSKKYNGHLDFYYCNECGCPLEKKIYSPKNTCPLNKWKI
jgi:hypothetical protein